MYKQNHFAYSTEPMWAIEETPTSLRIYPSPRQSIIKLIWMQPLIIGIWLTVAFLLGHRIVNEGAAVVIMCCMAVFLSVAGPVLAVWIKWSFTADKKTDHLRADFRTRVVHLPRLDMQIQAGDSSYLFVHDVFTPGSNGTLVSEFNIIKRDGDKLLSWPVLKHLGYGFAFNRIGKTLMSNGFLFVRHKTRATEAEQGAPPYSKPVDGFLAGER